MDAILSLLRLEDLERLKPAYRVYMTDQPRSTTIIYTTREVFTFDDYGLGGLAVEGLVSDCLSVLMRLGWVVRSMLDNQLQQIALFSLML
jgi:hypothetical protein